ncbi:MAG: flagellar FlbD family protein [Clostridia bacterium]|nr:flagellar FlbD family protein [Clostridia bacterium]
MIILTKLNNVQFALNPDLIETIEENPDTTIRLVTKNIIIVKEPMQEVTKKIYEYRSIASSSAAKVIPNIADL